jgi:hypothetical protein
VVTGTSISGDRPSRRRTVAAWVGRVLGAVVGVVLLILFLLPEFGVANWTERLSGGALWLSDHLTVWIDARRFDHCTHALSGVRPGTSEAGLRYAVSQARATVTYYPPGDAPSTTVPPRTLRGVTVRAGCWRVDEIQHYTSEWNEPGQGWSAAEGTVHTFIFQLDESGAVQDVGEIDGNYQDAM